MKISQPIASDREGFRLLRDLINRECGIYLSDSKIGFLSAKLARRMSELGYHDFSAYYLHLRNRDSSGAELASLLDLVATNKTSFFRENQQFRFLEQVVLPIMEQRRIQDPNFFLRIWSAGCSTGEEAYSIAITLKEYFGAFVPASGRILATDISRPSLSRAREGKYTGKDLAEVPGHLRKSHFHRIAEGREPVYQVGQHLRELVEFHRLNLIAEVYPFRYPFDIVFCRNVLIYFDSESQEKVLDKISRCLGRGGYLFTGLAENMLGTRTSLRCLRNSVFIKD